MENFEIILLAPLLVAVLFLGLYSFYSMKLYYYLMNNKTELWEELTNIDGLGSGFLNPTKWMTYQFNSDQETDEKIILYKKRSKLFLYYTAGFFVLFIVILMIVASLWPE